MSSDLEVDDSAKTLIASWFGIDSSYKNESKNLEDIYDLDVDSGKSQTQSKKKKKENKTKEKKHIEPEQSQQLQVFTLGIPQKKTTSSFVEDKLQKKLKKLKQRKENTEKDIKEKTTQNDKIKVKQTGRNQRQNKPQDDDDDDDCSKVKMVGQMKKQTNEAVAYTIESLKKKLSEKNDMSKNQRKRLKKKLHNLQKDKEENGFTKLKEGESLQGEENSKIKVQKAEKSKLHKSKPSNTNEPVSDQSALSMENGTKNLINKLNKKTKKSEGIETDEVKNVRKRKKTDEVDDISVTTNGSVNVSPKKKKKSDHEGILNVESDESKASNNKKKKKKRNKGSLNDSTISDVSITKDIAIIDSPKKEVNTGKSSNKKDSVLKLKKKKKGEETVDMQNMLEKHGKSDKKQNISEQTENMEEVSSKQRSHSDVQKRKHKKTKKKDNVNESFVSVTSDLSLDTSVNDDDKSKKKDSCVENGHKKKTKEKSDGSSNAALENNNEKTNDIPIKNNHKKKKKLTTDNSRVEQSESRNIDIANRNGDGTNLSNGNLKPKKHKMEERIDDLEPPIKKILEDDKKKSLTEKSTLEEQEFPRKRKKHKTRSKQKNIKKDHRPEHMKPDYIQQLTKDKDKDSVE